jgi:hypothetical protein
MVFFIYISKTYTENYRGMNRDPQRKAKEVN